MKLTYDKEADAAYLYLADRIKPGEAVKTIEMNEDIIVDFDKNWKMLGIEILSARKILRRETRKKAKRIDKK